MLRVTTWFLEASAPPPGPPLSPPVGVEVRDASAPPLHFYRYLYETVGRDWLWVDRRRLGDGELEAIVHHAEVELLVAYARGCPAGFAELDGRTAGRVELAYFGLVPEQIGRAVGPWLLDHAVRRAWARFGPERLTVHTCSLDHPAARRTYERAGFVLVDTREQEIPDPRPLPCRPR